MKNIDFKFQTQLSRYCVFLNSVAVTKVTSKLYCTNQAQILRAYLLL